MGLKGSLWAAPAAVVLIGGVACTPPPASDAPSLTGGLWELQRIQLNDGQVFTAEPPENYTAEFTDAGEVFVQADCNRALGDYTVADDNRITITMGPTTLAACPDGSISNDYLRFLNEANSFFFQEDALIIELKFDSGSIQFAPAD